MKCRAGCGACCIALSISSAVPGMQEGKPAGVRCPHLTDSNLCSLFMTPERPKVCQNLTPSFEMCGNSFKEAMAYLQRLEEITKPDVKKILK